MQFTERNVILKFRTCAKCTETVRTNCECEDAGKWKFNEIEQQIYKHPKLNIYQFTHKLTMNTHHQFLKFKRAKFL